MLDTGYLLLDKSRKHFFLTFSALEYLDFIWPWDFDIWILNSGILSRLLLIDNYGHSTRFSTASGGFLWLIASP